MSERCDSIMLVESDAAMLEMLAAAVSRRFHSRITCVADTASALDIELFNPHDLLIVDLSAEAASGLDAVEQLCSLSRRPVIVLCDEASGDELIRAMRMGVRDAFRKPFAMEEFLDSMQRALYAATVRRQSAAKYHRMRDMVRRVIRERRDLNRRIELVCRDLVESHRRLARRVVEMQHGQPSRSA